MQVLDRLLNNRVSPFSFLSLIVADCRVTEAIVHGGWKGRSGMHYANLGAGRIS